MLHTRWINEVSSASPSSSDQGWDLVGSPMTNGTLTASNLATDGTNYAIQPYDNTDNTWNATTDGGTFTTTTGVGYSMAKTTAGTVGFTEFQVKKQMLVLPLLKIEWRW